MSVKYSVCHLPEKEITRQKLEVVAKQI